LTPSSPTWDDIRSFLDADGWREIEAGARGGPRSRHVFYEKVLDDGRVLQTHVSHAAHKSVSAGRFGAILRYQLEVSREDFWECIRKRKPVDRPVEVQVGPKEHEAWIVAKLFGELHLSPDELEALSPEEAQKLVEEHWSKPNQ
jgi:hypothetical protein